MRAGACPQKLTYSPLTLKPSPLIRPTDKRATLEERKANDTSPSFVLEAPGVLRTRPTGTSTVNYDFLRSNTSYLTHPLFRLIRTFPHRLLPCIRERCPPAYSPSPYDSTFVWVMPWVQGTATALRSQLRDVFHGSGGQLDKGGHPCQRIPLGSAPLV